MLIQQLFDQELSHIYFRAEPADQREMLKDHTVLPVNLFKFFLCPVDLFHDLLMDLGEHFFYVSHDPVVEPGKLHSVGTCAVPVMPCCSCVLRCVLLVLTAFPVGGIAFSVRILPALIRCFALFVRKSARRAVLNDRGCDGSA